MLRNYKQRNFVLGISLAFVLQSAANAATDPALQERRLQLSNRQTELLARLDRVDDIGRAEASYVALRAQAYDAVNGLPAKATAWDQGASAWLDQWQQVLKTVAELNTNNAAILADQLQSQLLAQATAYDKLRQQATILSSSASRWRTQLQSIPSYPAGYVKGYEGHTTVLNRRISELNTSLLQYQTRFSGGYVQRWATLLTSSRTAIADLLKLAILHYPDLAESLQLARQALLVSEKIDPAVVRVNTVFDQFSNHRLAKRLFHQEDSLLALRKEVAAARADIAASGLDDLFTAPALASIENSLATAEKIQAAPSPLTLAQVVGSYVHTQQRILTLKCRDPKQARLLNCELLQTLNRFNQSSVSAMPASDLRLLEYSFDKVTAGPTFGGT